MLGATHLDVKGWYLCCCKYPRRYLNKFLNIYSLKSSFDFRGNSTIQFNHKIPNKQSKAGTLIKLTKNLVIIPSIAYELGAKWNIYIFVNVRIDTIPPAVCIHWYFDGPLPLLIVNLIIDCPFTEYDSVLKVTLQTTFRGQVAYKPVTHIPAYRNNNNTDL